MRKIFFTNFCLLISIYSFSQNDKILFNLPETINDTDILLRWTKFDDFKSQNIYLFVKNVKANEIISKTEISKLDFYIVRNLIEFTDYEYWIQIDENQKTNTFPLKLIKKTNFVKLVNAIQNVYITSFNGNILNGLTICNNTNTTLYSKITPVGNINVTYQWTKNGIDLVGETNSTLNTSGIGNYSLKVYQNGNLYNSVFQVSLNYSNFISTGPFKREPTVQCNGRTANLFSNYDTQTATYQWTNNGVNIPGATNKIYVASQTGAYKLKIQENGCTIYQSNEFTRVRFDDALFPNIFIRDSLYCENGNSINLQSGNFDPTYFSFQWMKNGVNIANATSYSYDATDAGIYSLKMIQDNCTSISEGLKISKIVEYPKSIIIYNHTDICLANSVTIAAPNQFRNYQWIKDGVNLIGQNSSYLLITQSGTYKCQISSNGLCPTMSDDVIITNGTNLNPQIEYSVAKEDCGGVYLLYKGITYGGQVDLTNLTYQWVLNGVNISNATNHTYYATQNGNYQLRVTNTLTGCSGLSNILTPEISNSPKLTIDKSYSGPVCKNTIASLWLNKWRNSETTYQWKKNGILMPDEIYDKIYIKESGNYSVIFHTGNCNTESSQIPIRIDSLPNIILSGNSNILLNQEVTLPLTLSGGSDYYVKLNDGSTYYLNSNTSAISKLPLVNTSYSISAFGNHCGVGSFSGAHIVNILSCPPTNTINNSLSSTITLKASENIIGQNLIQTEANVRYSAKKSVVMYPPFKTESGAIFQADTEGCNN